MLSTVVSQSVNVHLLGLREVNLNSRAAQLFDVYLTDTQLAVASDVL